MNNFLQPFLADGQQYTHDEFLALLLSTLDQQLTVSWIGLTSFPRLGKKELDVVKDKIEHRVELALALAYDFICQADACPVYF